MNSPFPDGELEYAAELGAVDHSGVRLWVRQPGAREVEARLLVAGQPPVVERIALSAATDWTGVVELRLASPAPDAPFVCTTGDLRREGRLAPAPDSHAGLTFAFGSCHQPFVMDEDGSIRTRQAAAIYPVMAEELPRRGARFLLLCGDQVYCDELGPLSVRARDDRSMLPFYEEDVEAYRRITRGFFGQAGMRDLRALLPTYMTWDDHDIFNNWGSHQFVLPREQQLFEAATRVYAEYQHARNPRSRVRRPPFHFSFRHGDIGFFVLDVRGARDFTRHQMLGAEQWEAVQSYLRDEARDVQTLFLVCTVPIAHVARWMADVFDHLPGEKGDSVRDRWCSAAFIASRDALLDELFAWQHAAPARQVCVLSGDVHCASAFTIRRRDGRGVIQQFTSSALTSPLSRKLALQNRIAMRVPNFHEPEYRFQQRLFVPHNNYGLVRAAPLVEGGHRVGFYVRALKRGATRLVTAGRVISEPEAG